MKTRIFVDSDALRANEKSGDNRTASPVVVKQGQKVTAAHEVIIDGPCKVVHPKINPYPPKVWIETEAKVVISE